jgi:membrane protease YdiL (CAAX protease family)
MSIKTLAGYLTILIVSFLLYSMKPAHAIFYSSLPVLMLIYPIAVGYRVKLRFSLKDLLFGLVISFALVIPYFLIFGSNVRAITVYSVIFQLLSVALPEEYFFRGFLQDSIGKSIKAVLFVSLLFSLAHLPRAVFLGEWISLLSFFPSVVMGWLYMKTNNILPGTIFHLLANLVYQA